VLVLPPAPSRKQSEAGCRKPEDKKALRRISATSREPNAGLVSLTMACLSYLVGGELQGNHRIASLDLLSRTY
jgi:hypothetical protein